MADELNSPAIIGQVSKSTGHRARDVRTDIKEMGFEKGIERSVTLMADELVGLRQTVAELAQITNALIDRLLEMGQINEQIAQRIDTLRSRDDKYEESKEH